jgi:hypothetical protein
VFDRYMIIEGSLRTSDNGFSFDIRIPYYRGIALSMIEAFEVTVDGQEVARDAVHFVLRGSEFTHDELEQDDETRWEFGEIATLRVDWPGGLAPGDHVIGQATQLRISYLPAPLRGADTKTLAAA